ncbi:MAG: DUF2071 domain-containing protein, partial [Acidimicrobiales bacterium]|nr:DUF2071 domain-containing protein [Acidimicrobiales bacterium]
RVAGRACSVPAEHPPWSLQEATVVGLEESLLDVNGLRRPAEPALVRYSPGTDVRLGFPRRRVFPESALG